VGEDQLLPDGHDPQVGEVSDCVADKACTCAQALSLIEGCPVGLLSNILQVLRRLFEKSCNGLIAVIVDHVPHELFHCRTE
jgi:hypothetical protein